MLQLNQIYTTKELAKEMDIGYQTFRKNRQKYENHLRLFYDFMTESKGRGIIYIFTEQYGDFIPYKDYCKSKKNKLIQNKAKAVIKTEPRQTGSNIARIIYVEEEIQALNCQLSTITNYTRANLKELINSGYYTLTDYKWCFLDYQANQYIEMTDAQVKELRSYFRDCDKENLEEQENAMTKRNEGLISKEEANNTVGELKYNAFIAGIEKYMQNNNNCRPMKVPLYQRCAF